MVMNRIRKLFNKEIFYRLFIVLQVVGILCIIYMDVWYGRIWDFFLDVFNPDHYGFRYLPAWEAMRSDEALFFLVAPFAISKAIDWVVASKDS
jgi:hypothetical protein